MPSFSRRSFAFTLGASFLGRRALPADGYLDEKASRFKITDLELTELEGHYQGPSGVNRQPQVNPLDIYDNLRPAAPYADKPGGTKTFPYKAIYLRIKTDGDLFGLYGPFEKEAAIVVNEQLPHISDR